MVSFRVLFQPLHFRVYDDLNFGMYPNPTKNYVTIKLNNHSDEIENIVIYDLLSKIIFNQSNIKSNFNKIDVSTWRKGVYLIEVKDNSQRKQVKKLILD